MTCSFFALAAARPGDKERRFLQEAAQDNLQNVFIIRLPLGYFAFPRTFVMAGTNAASLRFYADLNTDATLEGGDAGSGTFVVGPEGQRVDTYWQLPVMSSPMRSEKRGDLDVEYFDSTGSWKGAATLLRRGNDYLQLRGAPTTLVDPLLEVHATLKGAPDRRALAPGSEDGALEKQFLREAVQGHFENVFLMHLFSGYLALPRTFVGTADHAANLTFDTGFGGQVTAGYFHDNTDGTRRDGRTGADMPVAPARVAQHDRLKVEYFASESASKFPVVMIHTFREYLLLKGPAALLADDVVATFPAVTKRIEDEQKRRIAAEQGPPSCESRVVAVSLAVIGQPLKQWLRVYPGTDTAAWRLTGFAAGDVISAINGREVAIGDTNIDSALHDAAEGKAVTFSIRRAAARLELKLDPVKARQAMRGCPRR